jgi:pimeloyl-ACP methyl ester carboxylesterase
MSSEHDTWSDLEPDEIERRVARFPDARWRSIPGAGHYVHIEQPDLVLHEIEGFLAELGVLAATA